MERIKLAIKEQPQKFTAWFKIALPSIEKWWRQHYS